MGSKNGSLAVVVALTHYCPIYQTEVGREQCQSQSMVPGKNVEHCCARDCKSPWRFCIACMRQGYKGRNNLATSATKGLCDFHQSHGPNAVRSREDNGEQESKTKQKQHYQVVGEVIEVMCERVKPFKTQPRTYFDPVELKSLETSINVRGQIVPALVKKLKDDPKHDFELVDGQRRWHACTALGRPLRVEVQNVPDVEDQFERSIIANFCRPEHTPLEKARGIDRLLKNGRTWVYVADCFGRSVAHIQNYRKLLKLHPTIQARLEHSLPEDKRLALSVAFSLTDLPHAEQLKAMKKIDEEGLNVNQARELIRQHGEEVGVMVGSQGRTPREDFLILRNYLRKISEDSNRFLSMSKDQVTGLFKFRDAGDLSVTISQVENAMSALSKIKTALSKIGRV